MTPKIVIERPEIWRCWWPGNWTTSTNTTLRIDAIKIVLHLSTEMRRSSVVLNAHTTPYLVRERRLKGLTVHSAKVCGNFPCKTAFSIASFN
jgi:hypothetical protein